MKIGLWITLGAWLSMKTGLALSANPNLNPLHELFEAQAEEQRVVSITGILHNEQDEAFGLHFAIYRQNQRYQVLASLSDLGQQKILWQKTTSVTMQNFKEDGDHLGPFFWNFSPINSTLILGYGETLNLKFDLLEPTKVTPTSSLTKSLKVKQFWSGQINGHFIFEEKEQFVTGQGAWLQQIWQNRFDSKHHAFQSLVCKFDDGQALTALQIHEEDALRAANVSRFDAQGKKQNISQFINFNLGQNLASTISLGKTKETLYLKKLSDFAYSDFYLADIQPEHALGFCTYQTNPWQSLSQISLSPPEKSSSFLKKTLALSQKPFKIAINLKNKSTS